MKKIVKIGMAIAAVVVLFLSMPSLNTMADFFKNSSSDKKVNPTQFVNNIREPRLVSELATGTDFGTQFVDDVRITDKNGKPIQTIKRGQEFKVIYDWSVPDDVEVKEGDFMTIPVPKEASIHYSIRFPVVDEKTGEKMGEAILNHQTNIITMIFTNYPENHDEVKGQLEFVVRLEVEKNTETIKIPIIFETANGATIEIEIIVPGESDNGNGNGGESPIVEKEHLLGKYGLQGQAENRLIWTVYVNEKLEDLSDAVFIDQLGEHQTLDAKSLKVWKGTGVKANGTLVNSSYVPADKLDVEYRDDGFTINFGDMGKTVYQMQYTSIIDPDLEIAGAADFDNFVYLTANEIQPVEKEASKTYVTGSGSGTGKDMKKFAVTENYLEKGTDKKLANPNETKFEVPYKDKGTFKTDTKLIEGYELVEYTTKIGKTEQTKEISDGQTIRLEVEEDTTITYYYEESKFSPHIYLRTKDNQLVIHYRNVDQLIVEVDGQIYETYDVLAQETDENISTPIRVNSDRTVVKVRGKLNGQDAAQASLNSNKQKND